MIAFRQIVLDSFNSLILTRRRL